MAKIPEKKYYTRPFQRTTAFLVDLTKVVVNQIENKELILKIRELITTSYETPNISKNVSNTEKYIYFKIIDKLTKVILDHPKIKKHELINVFDADEKFQEEKKIKVKLAIEADLGEAGDDFFQRYEKIINEEVKYNNVLRFATQTEGLLEKIVLGNSENLSEDVDDFYRVIVSTMNDVNRITETTNQSSTEIDFDDDSSIDKVFDSIYKAKTSTNSGYIKTGIKALDEIVGGFERGRSYLFLAAAKGGKSASLLNFAVNACTLNVYDECAEKGVKPVVLYLTLENTAEETMERIIEFAKGDKWLNNIPVEYRNGKTEADLLKLKAEKKKLLKQSFVELGLKGREHDNSVAQFVVKYQQQNTWNMANIENYIDQIEAKGKKVVMLLVDYIELVAGNYETKNAELRLILNGIAADMVNLGKTRKIAVLTAMQLNRPAYEKLNKNGLGGLPNPEDFASLSAENIGESLKLVQKVDAVFIVHLLNNTRKQNLMYWDNERIKQAPAVWMLKIDRKRTGDKRQNKFSTAGNFVIMHPSAENCKTRIAVDSNLPGEDDYYSVDISNGAPVNNFESSVMNKRIPSSKAYNKNNDGIKEIVINTDDFDL